MNDQVQDNIRTVTTDRVRTLVIDRPDKKNALTQNMYGRLVGELDAATTDPAIRVVVISGANGVFTAGNDIADFAAIRDQGQAAMVFRFLGTLPVFPKPLIAAVEGLAIGVGTTMLLHCDLVYASSETTFSVPFTRLGVTPEAGSSLLLPQVAGLRRATEMLMLGEPFDAERAREAGIVNEVVAPGELSQRVAERAKELAALPPAAVRQTKALIRQATQKRIQEVIDRETVVFGEGLASPESAEAFAAFFEKRPADFSDFK